MNNHGRLICSLLTIGFCSHVHAALPTSGNTRLQQFSQYVSSHLVTSVSTGPVWGSGGEAQSQTLAPDVAKIYTANRSGHTMAALELFAGVSQPLPHHLQAQLGVAVAATSQTGLSGDIWDDEDPQFNNYTYHYQLSHRHIALKGKLLADRGFPVMPWISVSLGVGFNRATSFTNTPTIFEAVAMPNFSGCTKTSFTYTLGVGVQRNIGEHLQAGIGYEFSDWGRSQLNPSIGQTTSKALSLSHFYTSGILVNLTYSA